MPWNIAFGRPENAERAVRVTLFITITYAGTDGEEKFKSVRNSDSVRKPDTGTDRQELKFSR
jgi:hypothetical protein